MWGKRVVSTITSQSAGKRTSVVLDSWIVWDVFNVTAGDVSQHTDGEIQRGVYSPFSVCIWVRWAYPCWGTLYWVLLSRLTTRTTHSWLCLGAKRVLYSYRENSCLQCTCVSALFACVSFKQHRCSFPRGWDSLRRLQPAFVWAPCCRADLLLKAEMLAVCGLCIIDADCDWVPRAIGYNLKKSQGGVNSRWTRREVSRRAQRQWGSWRWLSGFGLKRRCLKRGGAERRPDSGDTTSLPVHFNEPGSQGETQMIKFGLWAGKV